MKQIDVLIDKIRKTKNPVCVGLDTMHEYLPESMQRTIVDVKSAAAEVLRFNMALIDCLADIIPCVKVQVAYYEMYGSAGMKTFNKTLKYARSKGLVTIADVKRNDIGDTASAYAKAYLSGLCVHGQLSTGFDADFATINPYLGTDGVAPFVSACEQTGKGLFVLVKTSNPSSGEFQDLTIGGETLYECVGKKVAQWGHSTVGQYGYSSVGAVVGATYPEQAKKLRELLPSVFFLIPGYGAQGAKASDIVCNFDSRGLGGIINSSRGILLAHRSAKYEKLGFENAARQAVIDMQSDILSAFNDNRITL